MKTPDKIDLLTSLKMGWNEVAARVPRHILENERDVITLQKDLRLINRNLARRQRIRIEPAERSQQIGDGSCPLAHVHPADSVEGWKMLQVYKNVSGNEKSYSLYKLNERYGKRDAPLVEGEPALEGILRALAKECGRQGLIAQRHRLDIIQP